MSHIIIDRRKNAKGKSTDNRRKFVKRVRDQVKDAIKDVIRDGNIKDIADEKGKKVRIPGKGLKQPTFGHAKEGGISDHVHPGNKEFQQGDRVPRPQSGGGGAGGNEGSPDGEGEDSFTFHLTRKEFLDLFFEDMELPDMVKKDIAKVDEWKWKRAGFSVDGSPSRLNILRSLKMSKSRRHALRGPKKKKLKELEAELAQLQEALSLILETGDQTLVPLNEQEIRNRIVVVEEEIKILRRKIGAIPFIDDVDLRYNRWEKFPVPSTQAVMFCIMDVSISMGEWEKEMSKRFFMLLYLFLLREYERVEIVFIRHHSTAKEVDEQEFYYSRETGGTVVSTALEVMDDVVKQRYPLDQWNIFACQCSDGDNFSYDNPKTKKLMTETILPMTQYYAYVEIDRRGGKDSDLWPVLKGVQQSMPNLAMSVISDVSEIYPVFRGLFEKNKERTAA